MLLIVATNDGTCEKFFLMRDEKPHRNAKCAYLCAADYAPKRHYVDFVRKSIR